MHQVNGAPVRSIWETINIDIQIGHTTIPVRPVVMDMDVPTILGMDFPLQSQGGLDFRTLELIINEERYKCNDHLGSVFCRRVVVEETTTIPRGHEAIVPAYIKSDLNDVKFGIICRTRSLLCPPYLRCTMRRWRAFIKTARTNCFFLFRVLFSSNEKHRDLKVITPN